MTATTITIQYLRRTAFVALFLALLAATTVQRANANQVGDMSDTALKQAAWCEALGGVATIDTTRTPADGLTGVSMTCVGGLLDGLFCLNSFSGPICFFAFPAPPEEIVDVQPTEGIVVEEQPVTTPPTADETLESGEVTDEPVREPVVAEPTEPAEDPQEPVQEPVVDDTKVVEEVQPTEGIEQDGAVEQPVVDDAVPMEYLEDTESTEASA